MKDLKRDKRLKDIGKQLMDFSDEYGAFFVCMVLIPEDVEEIDKWRYVFGEDVSFLSGHGPKGYLLEQLTKKLKDIDDNCEFKKMGDLIH